MQRLPIAKEFQDEEFIKMKCPLNLTGADFYSITNKARQLALKRLISNLEESSSSTSTTTNNIELNGDNICLIEEDFLQALDEFQPTLNEKELEEYELYFQKYSNKQTIK